MNRNDFLDIMECSGSIDTRMTGHLNELVTVFPYFQSAHMLLLKVLKDNSDVRFSIQLRNSSIHVADREVLYRFLQEPPGNIAEEHTLVAASGEPSVVITEDNVVVEVPAEQLQVNEKIIEAPVPEADILPGHEIEPVSESATHADEIDASETVQEVLYIENEQAVIETAMNSDEIINQMEGDTPGEKDEEEAQVIFSPVLADKHEDSFEKIVLSPGEELLELETGLPETAEPDPRKLQSELIDRFIIANPRITPDRERKDVPAEDRSIPIYNESVFITETLAKIYISQGYYSKAIEIFEKLSLKYPEKSSYFATQIEKVKEFLIK